MKANLGEPTASTSSPSAMSMQVQSGPNNSPNRLYARRPMKRRLSTPQSIRTVPALACNPLPSSLAPLDLSSASPGPLLASVRLLVLSHLAELEGSLSSSEPSLTERLISRGEETVEEARAWAREGLEMLRRIRVDVCSHLPDLPFDAASVEEICMSYLHDLPGSAVLNDLRTHLPELPSIPDFELPDMQSRLQDVRARLPDVQIDLRRPMDYLPTLSHHLQSLHSHLSASHIYADCPIPSLPSTRTIADFLDKLLSSDLLPDVLHRSQDGGESTLEKAAKEVEKVATDLARALKQSLNGSRLVTYMDLPHEWRNNPFVSRGYRFIPLNRWHIIILSLFALHNETLNIHTHMIPFLYSLLHLSPSVSRVDVPEKLYSSFAALCLFCSVVWHIMSGCADLKGMELCARVDYVGIGWLISASVGTIAYYGLSCDPHATSLYLALCVLSGIAGSVFPFMKWFNDRQYKGWRVAFFFGLAFTSLAPLAHLSYLYGTWQAVLFVSPVVPSLVSYVVGVFFYVSHVPERFFTGNEALSRWTDLLGGGSHAIWHGFIVLAIYQHKWGMREMRAGVSGEGCSLYL